MNNNKEPSIFQALAGVLIVIVVLPLLLLKFLKMLDELLS